MLAVYVDESGTHAGSPVVTMGGFVFKIEQALRFQRDWKRELKFLNLEYAHMTDCVHGEGPYKKLSKEDRIKSVIKLNGLIKHRSIYGFSIDVNVKDYDEVRIGFPVFPEIYTFCLVEVMKTVAVNNKRLKIDDEVAYVFESGHEHASQGDMYARAVAIFGRNSETRQYKVRSCNFLDKRKCLPLQAADLMAWHSRHYVMERGKRPMRKDFEALLRKVDQNISFDKDKLKALQDEIIDAEAQHLSKPDSQ